MTDNDIIKALECCTKGNTSDVCVDCPLRTTDICTEEENGVLKLAFDLINRQKAENENLKDILYDADGVNLVNYWHQQCKIAENGCRNFEAENENLKAEIEKCENIIRLADKTIEKQSAEIKRLEQENFDRSLTVETWKWEAVEEFARKLKCGVSITSGIITCEDVDNLVKEMVGDAK